MSQPREPNGDSTSRLSPSSKSYGASAWSLDINQRSIERDENSIQGHACSKGPRSPSQEENLRSIEKRLIEIEAQGNERLLSLSRNMSERSHVLNHSLFHERTSIGWTQHLWEIGKRTQEKKMEDHEDEEFAQSFHSAGPLDRSTLSSGLMTDLELINVLRQEVRGVA